METCPTLSEVAHQFNGLSPMYLGLLHKLNVYSEFTPMNVEDSANTALVKAHVETYATAVSEHSL